MAYTPVELRHVRLERAAFGYRRQAVDRLLQEVADSFEQVWRERAELVDRAEHLETDLARYRDLESLLRTTMISAERAAQELKEHARREADLIVGEAHAEARALKREALAELERLAARARDVMSLLRSALDLGVMCVAS